MEKGTRRTGKTAWELSRLYTDEFKKDLASLNIHEPTIWCRATDHIQEQIDFISCLVAKGFTYRTSDGIYFDTSCLTDYGYLARLDIEGLQAGMRIEMGEKRNPTDFALWKFSPKDQQRQMEWESPWGVGFPGWHIECSAMSVKYLGTFFDIHCGGEDHIPVHHTNEIAQTEGCYGTHLANFWLHGHFLQLEEDTRMSKSGGNFLRLQTLIDKGYDPLAYRLFCLNALYRAKLTFNWEGLDAAAKSLERLRAAAFEWGVAGTADPGYIENFTDQVNDDLNMPRTVAVTWELVKSDLPLATKKATLLEFDRVLGLHLGEWKPTENVIPDAILAMVEQRQQARRDKRWQDADAFRKQITEAGYSLEDTPQGPRVKPAG